MKCQARQRSDQMHCAACGLTWDINDPEPPKCNNGVAVPLSQQKHSYTRTFRPAYIRAREEVTALLDTPIASTAEEQIQSNLREMLALARDNVWAYQLHSLIAYREEPRELAMSRVLVALLKENNDLKRFKLEVLSRRPF